MRTNASAQTGSCTIENAIKRREWGNLSVNERARYIEAVLCLSKKPPITPLSEFPGVRSRYDDFVATHINQTNHIHSTSRFLPWHRYLVWSYENALRTECGYVGAQPYYNWAKWAHDPEASPMFDGSDTSLSGNGEYIAKLPLFDDAPVLPRGHGGGCIHSGPFSNFSVNLGPIAAYWQDVPQNPDAASARLDHNPGGRGYNPRCIRRDISKRLSMFATSDANVTDLITNNNDYTSFQKALEATPSRAGYMGVHFGGHYTYGGDPGGDFYLSPGDPVFYFHHASVDRTWWTWQNLEPETRPHTGTGSGCRSAVARLRLTAASIARAMDDLDYLEPGFDPNSLTVPKLRNVLVTHDVTYPSNAKKPQLVQLFNEEVAPKANILLSARRRLKPSSKGIVDVPSSQASSVDEEYEQPPTTTRRSTGRRRTRASPTEDFDATLQPPPEPSTSRRRTTVKHTPSSDAEPEVRPAARRTRHSATPAIKVEDFEPEGWIRPAADSPFTSENPFQSGSSPPQEPRGGRRKTLDASDAREKRKSMASRRRTEGPKLKHDGHTEPPVSSHFNVPILRRKKEEEQELVPAGEEFTPEEAQEIAEQQQNGTLAVVPRRKKKGGSGGLAVGALTLSVMLAAVGFAYRNEKIEVGYCGVGRDPSSDLQGITIPEWAQVICQPCPPHAICSPLLVTACETDFMLKPHPLSLAGLVPLPPTCEPDSEKSQRVAVVSRRGVERLREQNAAHECNEPLKGEIKPPTSPFISEQELKATLSSKKSKRMSQEEFDALWEPAIGEMLSRDEIEHKDEGGIRVLRSTSLANQPLLCALRQSIRATLVRYLWIIAITVFSLIAVPSTKLYLTASRSTEETAKKLAEMALDRLSTQASLHASDPEAYPEPYISMSHLRDDVLRNEFSAKRRAKLWERVQVKVEGNSNCRPMVREGKHGDVSRVWEWIGAVQAIEGVEGPDSGKPPGSRRQSARFGNIANSPHSEYSTVPEVKKVKGEMGEVRKWDEGRPIY
ncbi:hypothetical protein BLS_005896 [Venturia inaequalis]|uniref:Tyrosinase copper-binding domain-containing protein n=2 Tax=Venturia inaequalis TaxID=5025 RepID=A0A8H3YQ24_VENIN|nr:hypothetical protein BLS_005896 [Venturia inaequalis]KAE9968964.1 hypothetical protein EG328_007149 [Venturia inaequalis]